MGAQRRTRQDRDRDFVVVPGTRDAERVVRRIASRQQGNVTHAQLLHTGIHRRWIANRVERGLFRPMHRGVYFVGHGEITPKARAMAAVLACGDGAVVSHRSATYLYEFLPYPAQDHPVDVTVPGRRIRSAKGIVVHFTTAFDRRDIPDPRRDPDYEPGPDVARHRGERAGEVRHCL